MNKSKMFKSQSNLSRAKTGSVLSLDATKRWGSTSTLVLDSTMEGQNMMSKYLKIALTILNDEKDDPLKLGRPVKIEDFSHLTSESMCKIVSLLLKEIIGEKPVCRIVPLTEFNSMGIGDRDYDCGIDVIYHSLKQIFPVEDELLHYSVLLLPARNPKRTKAVIAYIVEFLLMCDGLHARFEECFHTVMAENDEKGVVCGQIDELKESLNLEIQKLHADKERLPLLQKETEKVEESIRKQQGVLAKLKVDLDRVKREYEKQQLRLKELTQDLECLNSESAELESMIVLNPMELQSSNAAAKHKFDVESKNRERIGAELEKLRRECDAYESLMGRSTDVINNFQAIISQMNQTRIKIESYTKSGNDLSQINRKLEQLRNECVQLEEQFASKQQEVNHKVKKHETNLLKIKNEIGEAKVKTESIRSRSSRVMQNIEKVKTKIAECQEECTKLDRRITHVLIESQLGAPQDRKNHEQQLCDVIKKIQEDHSHFPVLDMEPVLQEEKPKRK